jgi:hypothetical protein
MTSPPPLAIEAFVHEAERPALAAASRQLADSLSAATGAAHSVALRFSETLPVVALGGGRRVVVGSMLVEIPGRGESLDQTEVRWRDQLAALKDPPFLCTIFRYAGNRESPALVERFRRLNFMAIHLSHATGAAVVDIDRTFGYFGARQLQTDYRLGGRLAAELAGHAIVASILAGGLDDVVPADAQERAQKVLLGMLERLSAQASWRA